MPHTSVARWLREAGHVLRAALLPPPRHLQALLDRIERMP